MDAVISALIPFYEAYLTEVAKEFQTGEYEAYHKCPSYSGAKAIQQAIWLLEIYYWGETKTISIERAV
ncbi:hypothetical protein [Bacillus gobiensis]|uniref:Uncharacterized protein n=1 Tax=Bacillus gobiensis TaxID=1441095 RepID=A0A0M4G8L1_9BACI|nr:hypothetical protein [Bacillus gobiensis]ALC81558.1 hypothetical protein AM592_08060 [Bacillus gobiensis]